MAEQQILNKHNRILISQIAFWLMVVVNFAIRKIPVEPFDSLLGGGTHVRRLGPI